MDGIMFKDKISFRVKASWTWWSGSQQDIIPSLTVIYRLQTLDSYWGAASVKINSIEVCNVAVQLCPANELASVEVL